MSRKINVLLVNKLYYPVIGGVENHVRDLAINLSKNLELNVRVLVANTSFKTELQEIDGVEVYKIASLGTFRSTPISPSFLFWLRKLKSDIYHFHFPYPFGEFSYLLAPCLTPCLSADRASRKSAGKLVVTYHSDIVRQKLLLALYKPFLKAFLKKADEILVGSPNLIKHSVYLGEVKEKCAVVHYGIDVKRFELTENVLKEVRKLRNCYGNKIVLFIGRLIYYKGIEYLLRAIKEVDGQLLLVGKGPLEDSLRELAKDLGIEDRVHFIGEASDEDLPAFYHACDVFVLPSIARSEAFGLVQLEAQACGKPVVSTELGTGTSYANLDGKTGFVVSPENSEELAKAINVLLEDEPLRRRMGEFARARVNEEFTLEKMAERVFGVYRELIH